VRRRGIDASVVGWMWGGFGPCVLLSNERIVEKETQHTPKLIQHMQCSV
jgi:hypothetical protein